VYSFREEEFGMFTSDIDDSLFHHPEQLKLQSKGGWHSFVLRKETNELLALIQLHVKDGVARSPFRSPYGSYLFSEEVSADLLADFIGFVEGELRKKGVQTIVLKNPPEEYRQKKSKIFLDVLDHAGYSIEKEETSALIPVTEKAFGDGLHNSEQKRLRKCADAGLLVQEVNLDHLEEVYQFLLTCRAKKGYTLSMTLGEIEKMVALFADRFFLLVVRHTEKIAAATISIRITDHVLYNFYHDHDAAFDHLSPVVLLNEGIYAVCQQKKWDWLDLGTSQMNGAVNESLLTFKLRLGAIPSRKLTFVKNLIES